MGRKQTGWEGPIHGRVDTSTLATGKMESKADKESATTRMEAGTAVLGRTTRSMDRAGSSGLLTMEH